MKFKHLLLCFLLTISLACTALLGGCFRQSEDVKEIVSVQKTMTVGLVDTYTITYSDGSTYNFEITNGKDADNLSVEELYQAYIARNPNASFEDFLKSLYSGNTDTTLTICNQALLSSLKVYTEFTEQYYYGFGMHQQRSYETAIYCGSAVIYSINDDYTYVITNYHVLYDSSSVTTDKLAEKIVCYLYGSESTPTATNEKNSKGCTIYDYGDYGIECEYVGGSITTDLAVIKAKTSDLKKVNENVRAIEFADEYHVGETAIAIGNSEDEGISVTKGIVSVDNEYIYYAIDGTNQRAYRSMRIDTAIYGGNSGGGLFDSDGKLIGITNAGDSTDQNINYAIPVNIVKPIVENILYYSDGDVKVLKLGITVLPKNSKYVYYEEKGYGDILEDVYCDEITSGSLAEDLGLKEGDKLVSLTVNGKTHSFNRYFNLGDILYTIRQGDEIYFTYYRGDIFVEKSTEVTVTSKNLVNVS